MKFGKIINREIVISPSENMGFIVTVGCGRFVYTDKKDLVADFEVYLNNTGEWESNYGKTQPERPERVAPQPMRDSGSGGNGPAQLRR